MRVGVTGHQERPGIDWSWVRMAVRSELLDQQNVTYALSSLASGSDQLFAKVALELAIPVMAVIPIEDYEKYFNEEELIKYRRIITECEVLQLRYDGDSNQAFLQAGRLIVNQCDLLFAVWDGEEAEGKGGTGDIVQYAQSVHRPLIHINVTSKQIIHST